MKLYSIMPLFENRAKEIADDIERQYKDGIATEALFSMTLVPEGDPVVNKAKILTEKFTKIASVLRERGHNAGILAQATIGHGYKLGKRAPFQHLVTLEEGTTTFRVCPYDEGFRSYIKDAMATLASAKPTSIMVDDDMRLFASPKRGCSCPLHLAEISKRAGRKIDREELYRILDGTNDESKRMMKIYMETQIDALIGAARAMREGIDSVDPTLQGSFCVCGDTCEGAVEIATILAGKGNPVIVRVNNGNYTPEGAKRLTYSMCRAATQMAVMNEGVDYFLAETDTCPQNRYSTSAANLHSHFVGSILEGVSGCKHWITRLGAYEPKSGEAYRKKLGKYSGFYNELSRIVPTLKWQGCRIPLSKGAFIPNLPISDFRYPSQYNGWNVCVLERLGLPMYFSAENGGVACFDSRRDELFSDEEILKILSGPVFLAVESAKHLIDRGFGKYLGVDVLEISKDDTRAASEIIHVTGSRVNCQVGLHRLLPTSDKTEACSTVIATPEGGGSSKYEPLFPGVTLYNNELGGTVVVFSGTPEARFHYTTAFSFLCEARKLQLIDLLKKCNALPIYYPDDADVYLRAANCDSGALFCSFINLSLDTVENITLVADRAVNSIKRLTPDGKWENVDFAYNGEVLTLELSAYTLDPVILILS